MNFMSYDQAILISKFTIPFLLALVACWFDLKERRIPNFIAVSLLASGIVFHVSTGGWQGLGTSISGFAVGFSVLLVLYLVGGGGAGDVKFMGGVGAWIGPYHILLVFVMSAILVALIALGVIAIRFTFRSQAEISSTAKSTDSDPGQIRNTGSKTKIPYAVPAAMAIILRLFWLILIQRTT